MSRLPTGQRLASPPVHRRSSIEPIGRAAGTIGKALPLRDDTFEVTRLAYDPRCYWLSPHKSLPSREALPLWIGLRPLRQVPILGRLVPQIISPIHVNLFDRLGSRDNGLPSARTSSAIAGQPAAQSERATDSVDA